VPSLFKYIENHALLSNYYSRKYIDNYSNTASGIPAYFGLFVSCLSDILVDIVSDLPLFSLLNKLSEGADLMLYSIMLSNNALERMYFVNMACEGGLGMVELGLELCENRCRG